MSGLKVITLTVMVTIIKSTNLILHCAIFPATRILFTLSMLNNKISPH